MAALKKAAFMAKVMALDAGCTFLNLITPNRKPGSVTPHGSLGADGKWPEFVPAREGDSRCSCPALNAMANHGILPRDGKGISFIEMGDLIRATYNFSPSFCLFVPKYAANMLNKDYYNDHFDLKDLDLHNGIEHDASLCRVDSALEPDQSKIPVEMIKALLAEATGKDADGKPLLTIEDLSRFSARRRVEARETNPDFTLEKIHKSFGSSNASTLLTVFGGRVEDIETVLLEERLPDGWESRVLEQYGLTIITFNLKAVNKVEKGIDEAKFIAEREDKKNLKILDELEDEGVEGQSEEGASSAQRAAK